MKTIRTDRAREKFITTLRATCNVSAACRASNVGRSAMYAWRKDDEVFAASWDEAEAEAIDNLEGVAYERAMTGQSDRLLEVLLKGHRRERYGDKTLLGSDPDNPLPTGFNVNLRKSNGE